MGGHRLTGPNGANFLRRVIADCEHKVEFRCTGRSEFIPILAAHTVRRQMGEFELSYCFGVNTARGMTSRAICQ